MSTQRGTSSPEQVAAAAHRLQILYSPVRTEGVISGGARRNDEDNHHPTLPATLHRSARGRGGRAVAETMLAGGIPAAESSSDADGISPQAVKSDNGVAQIARENRTVGKGTTKRVREDTDNVSSSFSSIRRSTRRAALEGRQKVRDSAQMIAKDERAGRRLLSTRTVKGKKSTRNKKSKSPRVPAMPRKKNETAAVSASVLLGEEEECSDSSRIDSDSMEAIADETHQNTEGACETEVNGSEESDVQEVVVNEEHHGGVTTELSCKSAIEGKKQSATTVGVHSYDSTQVHKAVANDENQNAATESVVLRVVESDSSRVQEKSVLDDRRLIDDAGTTEEAMSMEMESSQVAEPDVTGAAYEVTNETKSAPLESSNVQQEPAAKEDCLDGVAEAESTDLQESKGAPLESSNVQQEPAAKEDCLDGVAEAESTDLQESKGAPLESSNVQQEPAAKEDCLDGVAEAESSDLQESKGAPLESSNVQQEPVAKEDCLDGVAEAESSDLQESKGTPLESSNVQQEPVAKEDCLDGVAEAESSDLQESKGAPLESSNVQQEPVAKESLVIVMEAEVANECSVASSESFNVEDQGVTMELESSEVQEPVVTGRAAAVARVGGESAVEASEAKVASFERGLGLEDQWHCGDMKMTHAAELVANGARQDAVGCPSQDCDMEMAPYEPKETLRMPDSGRWSHMDSDCLEKYSPQKGMALTLPNHPFVVPCDSSKEVTGVSVPRHNLQPTCSSSSRLCSQQPRQLVERGTRPDFATTSEQHPRRLSQTLQTTEVVLDQMVSNCVGKEEGDMPHADVSQVHYEAARMRGQEAPPDPFYIEETAWRYHNPPIFVNNVDEPGIVSAEELRPIPPAPPIPELPNTGKCTWSFDEVSRVLLGNFIQENWDVEVSYEDEKFLLAMMERDDITCISEGLACGIDPELWNLRSIANMCGDEFYHKFRKFDREEMEPKQAGAMWCERSNTIVVEDNKHVSEKLPSQPVPTEQDQSSQQSGGDAEVYVEQLVKTFVTCRYKETDESLSMTIMDFARYVSMRQHALKAMESGGLEAVSLEDKAFRFLDHGEREHFVDVTTTVLYMIDFDVVKLLPKLYQALLDKFELPGCLPGGIHCMMNAVRDFCCTSILPM